MKKFIADESFWNLFPEAEIAVLSVKGVQASRELPDAQKEEIRGLLEQANQEARKYLTSEVISENHVPAVWRAAYQKFPGKKGARCSAENLLKRVLHGKPVGMIAPAVDVTNAISLRYAFPIGVENLDQIRGDLHLGTMKGGEDFIPIGSDEQDPPLPGEVAYYDEAGAVCRCFNWRDGQRTEVTDNTHTEIILMENLEPERTEDLQNALAELQKLMREYLCAQIAHAGIVSRGNPSIKIEE
ncbi:MAG: B3/4 domain-containing protein [Bulleidia sp.]